MGFTQLILLILFICTGCLHVRSFDVSLKSNQLTSVDITVYHRNQSKSVNQTINRNINQSQRAKDEIKLIDLNADVLFLIFAHLNIEDMLNLSLANKILGFSAGEVFRWKYHDNEIIIKYAANMLDKFHTRNKTIEMYDYKFTLDVLTNFGIFMEKLRIENDDIPESRSNVIHKFVNQYTSETLNSLHLGIIKDKTLEQFERPFVKLQEFDCSIAKETVGHIRPFSQLFPRLKRLSLALNPGFDSSFVDCALSHLIHVNIDIGLTTSLKYMPQIVAMMQKNPQIRSIEMLSLPDDSIKTISEYLPNIENLTIYSFDIGNETIHFENVQSLSLGAFYPLAMDKLSFSRLQQLTLCYYSAEKFNLYLDFFKKHHDLRILNWKVGPIMDDAQFEQLMAELPQLVELDMDCNLSIRVSPVAVSRFVESHKRLVKFQFAQMYERNDFMAIQELTKLKWNFLLKNGRWIVLERKKSTTLV